MTPIEQMIGRDLEREQRLGLTHFVTGQHGARRVEDVFNGEDPDEAPGEHFLLWHDREAKASMPTLFDLLAVDEEELDIKAAAA